MSVKKSDSEYTDARGNLHKQFADGRAEIYIGGYDKDTEYVDVTDEADKAVNRKRFLRYIEPPVSETVLHHDPEIATRYLDSTREIEDDGVPGIDSLDSDEDEN
jgi:hypothetical protein